MEQLTFDQAIELLEITNISKLKKEDLISLEKKSKKRWHPDKVAHLNDPLISKEYTQKFQQIEFACKLVFEFITGSYHAGEQFSGSGQYETNQPENIDRNSAKLYQQLIKDVWASIKEAKYKWSTEEYTISDGQKLKDLLNEDFKEDIAIYSIISFYYGITTLGLIAVIAALINPILGNIAAIILFIQALSCVFGFLPLSRFWLPQSINDVMIRFINFGLGIYDWASEQSRQKANILLILLVNLPLLFAKLIKYVILFPLYEIAKALIGDKVIGVVKQKVNYYADIAEWHIEDLIIKDVFEMTLEELGHLTHLYHEFLEFNINNYRSNAQGNQSSNQNGNDKESHFETANQESSNQSNSGFENINNVVDDKSNSSANNYCSNCGNNISSDQNFCSNCGTSNNKFSNNSTFNSQFSEESSQNSSKKSNAKKPFSTNEKTKNDRLLNRNRLKGFVLILLTLFLSIIGGYLTYNYFLPSSYEKAITSFKEGKINEALALSLVANFDQQNGKLTLSEDEKEKLNYIQIASESILQQHQIILSEIQNLPDKPIEYIYASVIEMENNISKQGILESKFDINKRMALVSLLNAHDSLNLLSINKFISESNVVYSLSNVPYVYVGLNSINLDSLFSLLKNPNDPSIKQMGLQTRSKLPLPPTNTALFFSDLHKADSSFNKNTI